MRIRVEVEWKGEPWRKRIAIKKFAIADAIFGVAIIVLYGVKLGFQDRIPPVFPVFSDADRWNNTFILIFLMAANLLQAFHASRLCYVVSQKSRDPTTCFEASKTWYDFTQFAFLFSTVKCIINLSYIIMVHPYPWVVTLGFVTMVETVFKFFMLYTNYGFMQDLKASLKYLPRFKFIPVREQEGDLYVENMVYAMEYPAEKTDFGGMIDVNANMKLLELNNV